MTFLKLTRESRVEMLEKKSRFIAVGVPTAGLDAFQLAFKQLEAEFSDADHICYAYRIRENNEIKIRCHDASEPSGTAGRPILSHLEGLDLIDTSVFVIRYFGGIKLGSGGLVRAYGAAAKLCLQAAPLAEDVREALVELRFDYKDQRQLEYLIGRFNAHILDKEFGDNVRYRLAVNEGQLDDFRDACAELSVNAKKLQL